MRANMLDVFMIVLSLTSVFSLRPLEETQSSIATSFTQMESATQADQHAVSDDQDDNQADQTPERGAALAPEAQDAAPDRGATAAPDAAAERVDPQPHPVFENQEDEKVAPDDQKEETAVVVTDKSAADQPPAKKMPTDQPKLKVGNPDKFRTTERADIENMQDLVSKMDEKDRVSLWFRATRLGVTAMVELLLNVTEGKILAETDLATRNAFNWALTFGHKDIVQLMIGARADVNQQDKSGQTPLHDVASHDFGELAQILIENKANINTLDELEFKPLKWAKECQSQSVIKVLEDLGAEE